MRNQAATLRKDSQLVLHLAVDFKRLQEQGKEYSWPRPQRCLKCGRERPWGHGYVGRCFDGCGGRLWLKRYRCPECGTVYTLRPDTHYRGFWAPWRVILGALLHQLKGGRWMSRASRQRQQYWRQGLRRQLLLEGVTASRQGQVAVSALKELVARLIIVSTHSVSYRQVRRVDACPELALAVPAVGFVGHLDATRNTADSAWKNPGNKPAPGSGAR